MRTRLRLCTALCLVASTTVANASGRTGASFQGVPTVDVLHAFADPPAYPWSEVLPMPDGTFYGTTSHGGGGGGTIYRRNPDGSIALLHAFNGAGGVSPGTRLTLVNGFIYFLVQGGPHGAGAIYRMNVVTHALTLLHAFTGGSAGAYPKDGLEPSADGFLYGVTYDGTAAHTGSVYRLDPASGAVMTVHKFTGAEGRYPLAAPVQGLDGLLYGTTWLGGTGSVGTVYRLDPVSGALTTLHSFTTTTPGPAYPTSALIRATDGFLYGVTAEGGASGTGAVFRVHTSSGGVTVVNSFSGFGSIRPSARLVQGPDGMLYGASAFGGSANGGVVYRVNLATNAITLVHEFAASLSGGSIQQHALARGNDGFFYGATERADPPNNHGGHIYRFSPGGPVEVVHRFSGERPGGCIPHVGLTSGSNGFLYGATERGGVAERGTLFRSTLSGELTTVHAFDPFGAIPNGATPNGSLTEGPAGSFYGVTENGSPGPALFRLNSDGTVTILHSFPPSISAIWDGPIGRLLGASNGSLYGVTQMGGDLQQGTIFKIDPANGTFVTVHSFSFGAASGATPASGLIEASGYLYGTTLFGGASSEGTIYKLHLATNAVTVIHSFDPAADAGYRPAAPLTAAPDGYLYGTTQEGGAAQSGALFRLDPSTGEVTAVSAFGTGVLAGRNAMSELVFRSGLLYGTTADGGTHDRGTIYTLDPWNGTVATLSSLEASVGRSPRGSLARGPDGDLYGVASQEGPLGGGTLFRLRLPPDNTAPTISVAAPAAATYPLHANVLASYTCTDAQTSIAVCTGGVANGAAIDTATLGPKVFTVQAADYAGNTTSRQVAYTVTKAATTTTITSTTPNPSSALQFVRLTAAVDGVGDVKPTGFVQFFDGATPLGSAEVNGFQNAAITTTALGAGTHSVTATYSGDASFNGSTSASVTQTVHPVATSTITALVISPANHSRAGTPAYLIAVVAPLGGGAPGGTVEFFEHGALLGTAPLLPWSNYYVAVLPTSGLAVGLRALQARYSGDGRFGGSISATTLHTVYTTTPPAATTTTVTTTPNPSASGQTFSLTIEVRSPDGVPLGPVHVYSNGWMIGQYWLTASGGVGRVTIPMTGMPRGLYVMSAMYIGWAQFGASGAQNVYHCVGCPLGTALQSSTAVR